MVYYGQEEPVPEVAKALCEEKTAQNATGYNTRHRPKGTLAAGLGQRTNRRGESLRQAPASSEAVVDGNFGTPEDRKEKFFIPDNFHLLAESEVTIKGLRIYGTPWVPWISGHWCFEAEEKELAWKWKQIPEGIDILVTHTPPRYDNHNIDVSLERDPNAHRHFGSYSLADRIREVNPSLVFCGHIHSGDHKCHVEYKKDAPHGNFVWNVSRVNERYFIGYPIRVVRFGEKTVIEREKDSLAIE